MPQISRGFVRRFRSGTVDDPAYRRNDGAVEDWEMNKNVTRFFALQAAHKTASDKAYAKRREIADRDGINLSGAQDNPEYKELEAECSRLYWEADALTPHVIRENLTHFGLQDLMVTAAIDNRDGKELGRVERLLSDVCGLRHGGIEKLLGIELCCVSLNVRILRDGELIGYVDSDGDFDFTAAPDLKTALGWRVATDGGRMLIVEGFDLDSAARMLLETIRVYGTGKEAFFSPWFKDLQKVFVYEKTSRFGDGSFGSATTLWRVATRELGQEHEGYSFCY